ncbi:MULTISPECIES: diacylglycerol kinase family protein [Kribbella]|uniref:YegS/Rv2252/BmrU family lipid kinase n=1 Tax=Kribbella pratensis TaxID=2512112 RepID=A0ABY2FER8_9ACTN|nr:MULTISPECIES: diacylglycerol kinase family protein [Kribbella]TDW89868.1 YegS/Rv2252/BmrU family lipid kinase [Kribbella pratensis]TDX08930.1 YegS/Rv2252/BmrU family lipid kinase [Kribbella sp. VKM Ac-2566]
MNHHPPGPIGRVLTVVLGALPFAVITVLVFGHWPPLARWDQSVAARAASYGAAHESVVDVWQVIGAVVLPWTSRAVIVVVAAYLWHRRARLLTVWLLTSAGAELGLVQAVKAIFERERPALMLVENGGFSYVSGHATAAFVMAGALGVVLPSVRGWRRRFRLLVLLPVIAVVWIASADRIALNVHYVSDVLGGWALGLAILTATSIGFGLRPGLRRRRRRTPSDGDGTTAPPRAAVIVNPIKVGDGVAFRRKVTRALAVRGFDDPLWLETRVDDAGNAMAKLAIENESDLVLVAGGDGTVRVVCSALAHTGIPVGVIPAGTGNLLARNLHIPLDLDDALERILEGRDRRIDLVRVNGDGLDTDRFAVMAGLGLDAAIISDAPPHLKKQIGWTAYLVSAAKNINHPSVRVQITIDDAETIERRVRTVVIGNVGMLQANIPLLPDARPDDGLLDVVVIAPRRVTQWPIVVWRLLTRTHRTDMYLERFTGRKVELVAAVDVQRQLDGDPIGAGRSLFTEIEPGALTARVPKRR